MHDRRKSRTARLQDARHRLLRPRAADRQHEPVVRLRLVIGKRAQPWHVQVVTEWREHVARIVEVAADGRCHAGAGAVADMTDQFAAEPAAADDDDSFGSHWAVYPPSTVIVVPVIHLPASLMR